MNNRLSCPQLGFLLTYSYMDSIMSNMNNPGTRIALQILKKLLSESSDTDKTLTVSDFTNTDFSLSTTQRTLRLLEEEGWITKGPEGGFTFSREMQTLFCTYTSSNYSAIYAKPHVKELAQCCGESAAFAVWQGDGITFSATYEMADSFHYIPTGQINRYNLHNAFNITCMAYLDQKQREELFLKKQEPALITNLEELENIVSQIRETECFIWEDIVKRITAPVFYPGKQLAGVIGISFFKTTYTEKDLDLLKAQVVQSALRITKILQS
ncbi:IclR family transcriptional regulator C-terminal domain-containing protein [uncultured Sphaerochaeta sp.]|uniref:IclR family transcriptional regulator domain-containing protein n=1 Tax=uncultured Sphaerochaeta sp. TaxID=886478 RepID=UPI002A0A1619|nr:IclR family transcriptional regulator C-terminal domain-containing protein [uncultured Sphaerochaeta sp.]